MVIQLIEAHTYTLIIPLYIYSNFNFPTLKSFLRSATLPSQSILFSQYFIFFMYAHLSTHPPVMKKVAFTLCFFRISRSFGVSSFPHAAYKLRHLINLSDHIISTPPLLINYTNKSNEPLGARRLIISLWRTDLNKKTKNDTYTVERTYLGNFTSRELIGKIVFNSINSLNTSEKHSVAKNTINKDKFMNE